MSRIEWRVDAGTQVVLRKPLFLGRKVELNGERVDGRWESKEFRFSLPDGRAAQLTLKADTMSRTTELLIDGKLIPDVRYVPKDLRCPACNSGLQLLDEYCPSCGHAVGTPARFLVRHAVQGATSAIYVLAALFALWGIVMFFLMRDTTDKALENLGRFDESEVMEPIDGVSYTAGELRARILWEQRGLLAANLMLSGLMLGLAWWSKRKPLAAILIATAVYAVVQVLGAIEDPRTLMQGVIVKIVIVAVLIRGIKGALQMRAENG